MLVRCFNGHGEKNEKERQARNSLRPDRGHLKSLRRKRNGQSDHGQVALFTRKNSSNKTWGGGDEAQRERSEEEGPKKYYVAGEAE